ncbi:MarR family transcriptional regulator [Thermogemmatispora onikobensis]|uniref:MarR family transcriptional regulator n=1 Tax=Thermogemmatispora onikobensis TaxID=732234 RepID=UPI0008538361|nr:MarR family transcriptional regulator [Thermogemmatispora onikobensis]
MNALRRAAAGTVTARQREVLTYLAQRDHWSVSEVAALLGVSSAAATKVLTRLERKGLIRRASSALDRRCADITVTRAALALLQAEATDENP